jgi:hypothetical protein
MARKHHSVYSDPTGAAAAASPAKRRPSRTKGSESLTSEISSAGVARNTASQPTADRAAVARLAYSYWEARGFVGGSAEEDWLRAERELSEGIAKSAVA